MSTRKARRSVARDLAAVAGATPDELRPLIDAFRAPGASFLTPYAPAPLSEKTVVDISHEALIRCWRRIASPKDGWLRREFDDGLAWRSLLVEAKAFEKDQGRVLSAAATEDRSKLFAARGEAWSRRYGGSWPLVGNLLDASRKAAARARRRGRVGAATMAALTIGALVAAWFSFEELGDARRAYVVAELQKKEALAEKAEAETAKALAETKKAEAEVEKARADQNDRLERMFVDGVLDISKARSLDFVATRQVVLAQMRTIAEHGNDVAAKMRLVAISSG
jgi:hypothetical protein